MNAFDYGRKITQMPGLQVEAWINPAGISPRIKKAAQKMIRSGILVGGYRSASRMLALQLMTDAQVKSTASYSKWGVSIHNAVLTLDTKGEVVQLLEAARMVELATSKAGHNEYIDSRYKRAMSFDLHGNSITMACYVMSISKQIAEVVANTRSDSQIKVANALADQLDGIEPIKANIHTHI
jgi:hypothetical protein